MSELWRSRLIPLVTAGLLPGLVDPIALHRFAEAIEQSLIDHAAIREGRNLPKAVRGPGPEFQAFAYIKRLAKDDWCESVWLCGVATAIGWDRPESIGQLYLAMYRGEPWTWARVALDSGAAMAEWIDTNAEALHQLAKFGDHRAYQSHRASAPTSTGRVIRSLAAWLTANPHELHPETSDFDRLYHALEPVIGFGRTARYDYARLLGLLGLAPLEPAQCYFRGSSGPQRGARTLFDLPGRPFDQLEEHARGLGRELGLGMIIVEDVCCQWQKSQWP